MSLSKVKISSIILLIVISLITGYFSVALEDNSRKEINEIDILNTYHLSGEQYKSYAMLDDKNYTNLNINIVKDRLEKHPYVENVEVKFDSDGKVVVKIAEKEFNAILIDKSKKYYVSSQFEILPLIIETRDGNYPLIVNPFLENELKLFHFLDKNEDIRTAFKMIFAMKLINPDLLNNISEIDLREGRDIVITLIDSAYPVVIGRENEVTKVAYLNRIWKFLKDENFDGILDYIDFRYGENVYLGLSEEKGIGV